MTNDGDPDNHRKRVNLQKKYGQRITIARHGKEAYSKKDYITAVKKYNEYLNILSEMKNLEDMFKLDPKMFDPQRDITELLLISQVFWELTKIYEMMPKLQASFLKTLTQFTRFTINQPYQVLNAEMLRRHIKQNKNRSQYIKNLNDAYAQIYVQSKKCYIATHCFSDNHWVTSQLRILKMQITHFKPGLEFTRLYYIISPKLIKMSQLNVISALIMDVFFKPILLLIAYTHRGLCRFFLK